MSPLQHRGEVTVFIGDVDDEDDLIAAAALAACCGSFTTDDEDECYVETVSPTCFNCRGRRWVPQGFTCTRGALRG